MPSRLSNILRFSLLAAIASTAALLMLNAAKKDSAIVDELAHIPAGYSYIRYLDYRLNPEHPPLIKALAALPLLFQKVNFPIESGAWQRDVNGEWALGNQFLYESGNDADKIISLARIFPILLILILIIAVHLLSKELIGRWWAFLPTFLVAFSPNILAHGHYVTTDIGATLGIFLATLSFLTFLESTSRKKLIIAGLAFGFAQLIKFSAVILIPYFLILAVIFYFLTREQRFSSLLKSILTIFLIGFIVVFLVYLIFTWNYPVEKQVGDAETILQSVPTNFIKDAVIRLSGIPFLRAFAEYLLGIIMVFQRSIGENTLYFLGEVSNVGHTSYFPLTFLWKEPPASLLMIIFAFLLSAWGVIKAAPGVIVGKSRQFSDYLNTHFPEFAMMLFVVIYWIFSIRSNLNIGVRHILPTLPFIYILTASAIKRWFSFEKLDGQPFFLKIFIIYKELLSVSVKSAILAILLVGYLVSTLIIAPNFLSYFNFPSGGSRSGYQLVTDSNYDWGQDLKRLKIWVDENLPPGEKIAVDYFGGGDPKYYIGDQAENWWSARGTPLLEKIKWLAVSINTIQLAKNPLGKVTSGFERKPEDEYQWLTEPYKPYARAGTSIFIYKLD